MIGESGSALIPEELRLLAKEEQVEIVVVVEIHPNRPVVRTRSSAEIDLFEPAFLVMPERDAGGLHHGQVHQTVVVVVSRLDRDDIG